MQTRTEIAILMLIMFAAGWLSCWLPHQQDCRIAGTFLCGPTQ